MPNIGKKLETQLNKIGIENLEQLKNWKVNRFGWLLNYFINRNLSSRTMLLTKFEFVRSRNEIQ
ncbi:TfoX/Sxy family protein [Clostridium butyricum]|uniref:TfoX/Sxy family protein n=1 Tax=Clostridium butyricum TaxID=1492 RepID=UPI001FB13B91|nr:TfoX/Sxy family protein [Clostridium butyricum]